MFTPFEWAVLGLSLVTALCSAYTADRARQVEQDVRAVRVQLRNVVLSMRRAGFKFGPKPVDWDDSEDGTSVLQESKLPPWWRT